MKKSLSICIPTYNRKIELESLLYSIVSQKDVDWSFLEVVISDNNSTDGTREVLLKYSQYPFINIKYNETNIGMIPNWKQAVNSSIGDFVWLVGSDDLLGENILKELIETINTIQEIPLIFLNNYKWYPQEKLTRPYQFSEIVEASKECEDETCREVNCISELIDKRLDAFTAIYTLIMKKEHWQNALDLYRDDQHIFSSAKNCFPHTFYITKNLFDKKGYYFGKPAILASYNVGWKDYVPLYITQYLPEIYRLWIRFGGDTKTIYNYKKILISWNHTQLVPQLINKELKGGEFFSIYKYITDFYNIPKFRSVVKRSILSLFKKTSLF